MLRLTEFPRIVPGPFEVNALGGREPQVGAGRKRKMGSGFIMKEESGLRFLRVKERILTIFDAPREPDAFSCFILYDIENEAILNKRKENGTTKRKLTGKDMR